MKRWNTPEIDAIEINKTESGFICTEYECWPLVNDNLKKCETPKKEEEEEDPHTDSES